MTPTELENASRQRYNAVGDSFWASTEIMQLITEACQDLASKGFVIERTFLTTSVASQREYAWPTYANRIMRITYNNFKLKPINFREQDSITFGVDPDNVTGFPRYYAIWNNTFYLTPAPDTSSLDIEVFAYVDPQPVTNTSTLEIPTSYHAMCINYVVAHMCLKDKNYQGYDRLMAVWNDDVKAAVKSQKQARRGDSFGYVLDEESLQYAWLGGL